MKNKKIYLISTPTNERRKSYPFSLMYLHSYLVKHGLGSEVIDCNAVGWKLRNLLDYLEANKAELVGITGYTYNRFYTYNTIREIKSRLPGCQIIVGGRHFSALATETLERLKEVNFVVKGEGEITLRELCDALYNNKSFNNILGIAFRDNGKIISNPSRPPALNLDELHYNLDDFTGIKGNYSFIGTVRRFPASQGFSIMAGRGCVGCCVFCSLSTQRVRFRNVENVLDEIERMIKITGLRNLTFTDPSLTASKKYITSLCEGILRRNLNIKWRCYSRADAPSEIFELMKKAGCSAADIALESASPRVLQAIKKYIKVEDVLRCVKKLHELGIKSFVYAMISLPEEREEDAEQTIRFLEDISDLVDGSTLAITQVFPDAALYNMAKERNLLPPNFNWFDNYYNDYYDRSNLRSAAPFYIEHLSLDFIKKMRRRFMKLYMKKFYDRYTFRDEFKKAIIPFLFDWKNQTLHSKVRRIKSGITRLPYVIKSRSRIST